MSCGGGDNAKPNVQHIVFPDFTPPVEEIDYCSSQTNEVIDEIVEDLVDIENVTVKLRISDTQTIAQVYPNRIYLSELIDDIARKFEVNVWNIVLKQCGKELSVDCRLLETGADEFGIHEFDLELRSSPDSDPNAKQKFDMNIYFSKYRLPDYITVHVPPDDVENEEPKSVIVEIQNKAIVKPFLCGYRNKQTGVEYYDAFTQTGPKFDKWKYRRYISRDTQTREVEEKVVNTTHDQMTQCFMDGKNVLYVSAPADYTITPKKYQTYAQKMRLEKKLEKIKLIQRNWRRFLMLRYIKRASEHYRDMKANRAAAEQKFLDEQQAQITREQRAKQFPKTKEDFDMLYGEVEKWKMAELKRIASMYEGASRIAEVNVLLDREIQMLTGIERQRALVNKSLEEFRLKQLLTSLGKPIKWIGYKDLNIHLDLLRTQRARFLTEIYNDLQKPLKKQPRMELIAKVIEILICQEKDYPNFPELVDLFEREKNLLIYTKHCDVEVLRKRQNLLFLELIKFSKDAKPIDRNRQMCVVCKQIKPFDRFALRTRQNNVDTCKHCYYLRARVSDHMIYNDLLRGIQREERRKRCVSSCAFIMQVDDIKHLLDKIWHGHSVLSKKSNVSELRLPRWNKSEDWAPWNCVCLTATEARYHYTLEDPTKVYDERIIEKVIHRHLLAHHVFEQMNECAEEFLQTGEWWRVGLNQQRTADYELKSPEKPKPSTKLQKAKKEPPCLEKNPKSRLFMK